MGIVEAGNCSMTAANRLEAAIDAYHVRAGLCGAIRISRNGGVLLQRAYGKASVQLGVENQLGTRFHIASVTKMFISAAVVRLACQGWISLHDRPSKCLPSLSVLDRRITIHHLLSHTSGLADVYGTPNLRSEMIRLAKSGGRLLDYLIALPHLYDPGARWHYSTAGFLLLAYMLEQVSGSPFDRLIADMFLEPLGLRDTGPDDPFRVNPGRATGQIGRDEEWRNAPNDELAEIEGPREFYSTVADLDRWATAILNGEVLNGRGLELTFSPYALVGPGSDFDPSLNYGYGWFLGPDYRMIGGMTGGFRATIWQYPTERLNIVMLWNNERINSQQLLNALRPLLPT